MARQRMIRPEIWPSVQVSSLTPFEFKVYIGLISFADDEGRLRANPIYLTSCIFPNEGDPGLAHKVQDAVVRIEFMKDSKDNSPLVGLYQIGDEAFIYHPNWHKHQKIPKSTKAKYSLPDPPRPEKYKEHRKTVNAYGYKLLCENNGYVTVDTAAVTAAGTAADTTGQRKKERKKE